MVCRSPGLALSCGDPSPAGAGESGFGRKGKKKENCSNEKDPGCGTAGEGVPMVAPYVCLECVCAARWDACLFFAPHFAESI